MDLGHPAHIHYFRNFVQIMKSKGHEFMFTARDKDVLFPLLDYYGYEYVSRGTGSKNLLGKVFYIFKADKVILGNAMKFKPDLFVSVASMFAAHISKLLGKPHIVFDDTEVATFEIMMYTPFTDVILNPGSFWKKYSRKQIFFDSFLELCYLAPEYYKPNPDVLKKYGLTKDEKYFVLRFVSWEASHDFGQKGLSFEFKKKLVEELKGSGKVLISSEAELPTEFEEFRKSISPFDLHHLLNYASLYVGEGATTASECVMLGTPAIFICTNNAGTLIEQSKLGLLHNFRNSDKVLQTVREILSDPDYKTKLNLKRDEMLSKKLI